MEHSVISYTLHTYHTCIALCLFSFFFFCHSYCKTRSWHRHQWGKAKAHTPLQLNASLVLRGSTRNIVNYTLAYHHAWLYQYGDKPCNHRLL